GLHRPERDPPGSCTWMRTLRPGRSRRESRKCWPPSTPVRLDCPMTSPSLPSSCPRAACWEDYSSVLQIAAGTRGDQQWRFHANPVSCRCDQFRSSPWLARGPSGPRKRPMADEVRQRLPRSDSRRPDEPDEDRESDDLAGLDERVVEERLNPEVHIEGRGWERPAVSRIQDDGRLVPDPVQQQMGRAAEFRK